MVTKIPTGDVVNVWKRIIAGAIEQQSAKYNNHYQRGETLWAHNLERLQGSDPAVSLPLAREVAASMSTPEYKVTVVTDEEKTFVPLGSGFRLERLASPSEKQMMQQWKALLENEVKQAESAGLVYLSLGPDQLAQRSCPAIPVVSFQDEMSNRIPEVMTLYASSPWASDVARQINDQSWPYRVYVRSNNRTGECRFVLWRPILPQGFDGKPIVEPWVRYLHAVLAAVKSKNVLSRWIYAEELLANGCSLIVNNSLAQEAVDQFKDPEFTIYTHTLDRYDGKPEDEYFVVARR